MEAQPMTGPVTTDVGIPEPITGDVTTIENLLNQSLEAQPMTGLVRTDVGTQEPTTGDVTTLWISFTNTRGETKQPLLLKKYISCN